MIELINELRLVSPGLRKGLRVSMLLSINQDNPQPRLISKVVTALHQGAIICYPTDTVYGIGCDIFNQKAVKRIHQLKNRPKDKPFSFMCSSFKDVSTYCHVSNFSYRLMKKHLPGPYTFILPTMKIVPKIMTSKQKTVGIRVADNRICQAIIAELGNPILTTTASLEDSEQLPYAEAFELAAQMGTRVDLYIDGGPVIPHPSSIISLIADEPLIIRVGKGDVSQF
jgi:tRNA threonylcarbamoyl adenosine modification protein (Sua5/YciO/YrdC/YwlC family)